MQSFGAFWGRAMKTELVIALIAAAVSLIAAGATFVSSRQSGENAKAIAQLQIDNDKLKAAAQREQEMSKLREPLARAAFDLQSRIYNIMRQELVGVYLVKGDEREKHYVINSTAFLIGQYLCWTEMVRREIQYIDLGGNDKTRQLQMLQDELQGIWTRDDLPKPLRIFSGEQRELGEALIENSVRGPECLGYGAFLTKYAKGVNPVIDDLKDDVASLGNTLDSAKPRLEKVQHALVDLLALLDPDFIRFQERYRTKV
jgi:hypothetical protein